MVVWENCVVVCWVVIEFDFDVVDLLIGIFDFGFGGLMVVWLVVDFMLNEDIVYLGDMDCVFYGEKIIVDVW